MMNSNDPYLKVAEHTRALSMPIDRLMIELYMPLFTHFRDTSFRNRFKDFTKAGDQLILAGGNPKVALDLLKTLRETMPRAYERQRGCMDRLIEQAELAVRAYRERRRD